MIIILFSLLYSNLKSSKWIVLAIYNTDIVPITMLSSLINIMLGLLRTKFKCMNANIIIY